MQEEKFEKIPGFPIYWVSTLGRVISTRYNKKKFLAKGIDGNGYEVVTLYNGPIKRTLKVSTIVAMTFLNHKAENDHNVIIKLVDGNKLNPILSNLKIVKKIEYSTKGVRYSSALKKWRVDVHYAGENYYVGLFETEAEGIKAHEDKLQKLIKRHEARKNF
jgi:hypothetical protein